ncbi:hypothetical protein TcCL_ESM02898 [Trypanosoma cruzi]|nr:hypothetical protein TcCL_Unassigned03589 [Trypanosoma cruzi]RNC59451.1 hypothetical protein TcCL_ESM02898 [Trypanosoma cruzi]
MDSAFCRLLAVPLGERCCRNGQLMGALLPSAIFYFLTGHRNDTENGHAGTEDATVLGEDAAHLPLPHALLDLLLFLPVLLTLPPKSCSTHTRTDLLGCGRRCTWLHPAGTNCPLSSPQPKRMHEVLPLSERRSTPAELTRSSTS